MSLIQSQPSPYKGFVRLIVRNTGRALLAYQVPEEENDESLLFMLNTEDLGQVLSLTSVADNCDIETIPLFDLYTFRFKDVSSIPEIILSPLMSLLQEETTERLTVDKWNAILNGKVLKLCPRIVCRECKLKRMVIPLILVKYPNITNFTCNELGLVCHSIAQTKPCDKIASSGTEVSQYKSKYRIEYTKGVTISSKIY